MSQLIPYDENKFDKNIKLKDILNTLDDSDIGYFLEVDLKYPDNINKAENFRFCPESKAFSQDKQNDYFKKLERENYTKSKKLICDWSDKKNYLNHYNMLKFYVRHGMVIDKVHEIISFKQSK